MKYSKIQGIMLKNELKKRYFDWMYEMVCDKHYKSTSYKKLLYLLNNIEFTYTIDMDVNRAIDGMDFRMRFGYECGYSSDLVNEYLNHNPCSVLEMMIALAYRVEEQIMDDTEYGNRTGQWFWNMIVSLGLGGMNDLRFDKEYVNQAIAKFLNREYESNGKGGLFTIENCHTDLREVEIWCQFMWYLNKEI